jgi:hypothetical protein
MIWAVFRCSSMACAHSVPALISRSCQPAMRPSDVSLTLRTAPHLYEHTNRRSLVAGLLVLICLAYNGSFPSMHPIHEYIVCAKVAQEGRGMKRKPLALRRDGWASVTATRRSYNMVEPLALLTYTSISANSSICDSWAT